MTTSELKDFIKEQCGNPALGIAPVEDFRAEEVQNLGNVNRIMSRYTPLTSADTPILHPREFMDNAEAVIVVGYNAFFGRDYPLPGNPPRGEIMNFFVNQDCVNHNAAQTDKIIHFLADHGYTGISIPTGIPIKIMAARSGLGRYGKNAVIHAPDKGSWLGLYAIFTDAPLAADSPLQDDCGACDLCQKACPTGALSQPYQCAIERCLTLHTLYNKGAIPPDIREKANTCIAQCNACLDACPKNKNLSVHGEISNPQDLVYPEIAPLVNMTDAFFQQLFGASFLEFILMDKKYLQRNAAIALGNYGDPAYITVLIEALETQPEEIVRSAAAWALGRLGTRDAKAALEKFSAHDPSDAVRAETRCALDRLQNR